MNNFEYLKIKMLRLLSIARDNHLDNKKYDFKYARKARRLIICERTEFDRKAP